MYTYTYVIQFRSLTPFKFDNFQFYFLIESLFHETKLTKIIHCASSSRYQSDMLSFCITTIIRFVIFLYPSPVDWLIECFGVLLITCILVRFVYFACGNSLSLSSLADKWDVLRRSRHKFLWKISSICKFFSLTYKVKAMRKSLKTLY